MKKILSLFAVASVAALSSIAVAEDKATTHIVAATPATAAATNSKMPVKEIAKTAVPEVAKSVTGTLKDGTKFEIGSDGTVTVINSDGTKTTAPDGVFTMQDDTTFNVKDGKKVAQ